GPDLYSDHIKKKKKQSSPQTAPFNFSAAFGVKTSLTSPMEDSPKQAAPTAPSDRRSPPPIILSDSVLQALLARCPSATTPEAIRALAKNQNVLSQAVKDLLNGLNEAKGEDEDEDEEEDSDDLEGLDSGSDDDDDDDGSLFSDEDEEEDEEDDQGDNWWKNPNVGRVPYMGPRGTAASNSKPSMASAPPPSKTAPRAAAAPQPAPVHLTPAEQCAKIKEKATDAYKRAEYKLAAALYGEALSCVRLAEESEAAKLKVPLLGNRAACYMMESKFELVVADCKELLLIDPNFVKGYMRAGKAHLRLGNMDLATKHYAKAKALEPANRQVAEESLLVAQMKNHWKLVAEQSKPALYKPHQMMAACNAALAECVMCAHLKVLKARALVDLGRHVTAKKELDELLTMHPGNTDAQCLLAETAYNTAETQSEVDRAMAKLKLVLQLDPDNQRAKIVFKRAKATDRLKVQANEAFKEGKNEEAYTLYTEALANDPSHKATATVILSNRAAALMKLERLDEAVADCTAAIAMRPAFEKAYERRARIYMKQEKFQEAVNDCTHLCKNNRSKEHLEELKEAKLALKKSKQKDYYKILGLQRGADDAAIRKAFKKMALQCHPDRMSSASDEVKVRAAATQCAALLTSWKSGQGVRLRRAAAEVRRVAAESSAGLRRAEKKLKAGMGSVGMEGLVGTRSGAVIDLTAGNRMAMTRMMTSSHGSMARFAGR
ncbi:hypothetical protein CYMTET_51199, partial [Cymbomonas tetramitiformis]